ncbi:MAG TPA: hypothetical protein VF631_11735 [Allosphingosinicella sp.]|uniref:hypothetical protein n=1 Tax=Allosphingosinicella sp. TaxID=2823234 RepID=UPI002F28B628
MVTMFVAITDRSWFYLLSAAQPDEVNFWQPSGGKAFRALMPGELFLFKLHSPNDYIVGGGVFSHASNVPYRWPGMRSAPRTASSASPTCVTASHIIVATRI